VGGGSLNSGHDELKGEEGSGGDGEEEKRDENDRFCS
jgi:hypothetical protein